MGKPEKALIITGCLLLTAAAMLSAYGFHGLDDVLTPEKKAAWGWAVEMHYYHAAGLIVLGILSDRFGGALLIRLAGVLMLAGIFIFSGLIYAEALGAPEAIGEIVPMGGTCFMVAWALTALAVFLRRTD